MEVRTGKKTRYSVQMPLTSLIDIVFLLLVFFLLTTSFLTEEGIEVKLPRADTAGLRNESEITIHVDADGRTFHESREVQPAELLNLLRERIEGDGDRLVVIKADREVVLDKAVQVMDVARKAGAGRLSLATEGDL